MSTITDNMQLNNGSNNKSPFAAENSNGNMDKDDFLKLLITQLQNQNPLEPMNDTEYVSQIANFSTLEQMNNMNKSMEQSTQFMAQDALMQLSGLIGQDVTWQSLVNANTPNEDVQTGRNEIMSVKKDTQGNIMVELDSGRWIDGRQVVNIGEDEAAAEES
ncbi:flagellar hook capping FlgD N-terminal domain-containing protein [Marinococcus luteus]|uniref:flagellar hook capping FlgD N-terminal domain-containing protein n=1 Tax=Marinococcus luteus TaxID=1122204 RepID=UPI002ACC9CD9|nr:flagellar hook capping FlgD N-terminal domain-containing protein [Marinococcus luteus]MDZ5781813.1 flagellar hook capping FlgD N-terminal domain-containing protein [Marinococcus luteus]